MKKILLLLLVCAVITFNAACSKSNSPQDNNIGTNQSEEINKDTDVSNDSSEENAKAEAGSQEESKEQSQDKTETTTTAKPEVKPTPKPETKPTPKPEVKPETKPQPETKPETKPEDSILAGDLEAIIEKIYSVSEVQLPRTGYTEVTSSNSKYYLGVENIEFSEALASEPLMSSFAHSVVLVRANSGSDIEKMKTDIKNNVDPRKWICVGVEKEDVIVDNIDNLIILIINRDSEKLHEAFLSLAK